MLSVSDEIKGDMVRVDKLIADAELMRDRKKKSLADVESHIDNLHVQRMRLEGQLARAEALYVKPQGPCVTEIMPNGQHWKV